MVRKILLPLFLLLLFMPDVVLAQNTPSVIFNVGGRNITLIPPRSWCAVMSTPKYKSMFERILTEFYKKDFLEKNDLYSVIAPCAAIESEDKFTGYIALYVPKKIQNHSSSPADMEAVVQSVLAKLKETKVDADRYEAGSDYWILRQNQFDGILIRAIKLIADRQIYFDYFTLSDPNTDIKSHMNFLRDYMNFLAQTNFSIQPPVLR